MFISIAIHDIIRKPYHIIVRTFHFKTHMDTGPHNMICDILWTYHL